MTRPVKEIDKELVLVEDDVLNIVKELKRLNPNYLVFHNRKTLKYELYEKVGLNLEHKATSIYKVLDGRFLNQVKQNKSNNLTSQTMMKAQEMFNKT